ncbi:MAG: extracellular solute-binding protein [Brevinema sp.]
MKKLIAVLLFLFSVGCAQSNNTITIYTALYEDEVATLEQLFKEDHPEITLNFIRESSGVLGAKLIAEKENPQADVVHILATSETLQLKDMGMLASFTPKNITDFDPRFYDTESPEPTWIGLSAWFDAFLVNKVELQKRGLPIPKNYADLTNSIYSNEIVFPNPVTTGTGYMIVSALIQRLGEEKAWEYMDALHKNVKNYALSSTSSFKTATQGEHLIGIGSDVSALFMSKDRSEIVEMILPDDGSAWEVELIALIKKDKIKEDAKIYMDWATSSQKALDFYKSIRVFVPLKSESDSPFVKKMIDNDLVWVAKNKKRILKEWEKRYSGGQ